ncbi:MULTISPECIES: DUF6538 domain-containing protein [Halocynthiibacter]|uniref:Tyrosine-type recombinase/integrase n=1 Tax=Halocynthiibacter halioticoli TaxID=2986804 RepID=A0AAE3J249_9RHOB|nr:MULTISPECIES: DUF6538 domain-containing protein [Halocynthiibacter]MCV6825395.1 tyrosine-type recombinase/integrase [Halocynthiibacter halioticoli]MCW4058396.1 tyrosine-type recombinase/integrase [Halocynthiibacter sp. SDUM655004]
MVNLVRRGTTWYLKRRVPVQFAKIEPRKIIWISLKTDSQSLARIRANTIWAEQVALWEAKLLGRDGSEVEKYRAAQQIASAHGFTFQHLSELQTAPLEDILERVEELAATSGTPDKELATALLGNVTAPTLKLSGLVDHVQDLNAHDNRFKSPEQMRLWLNPRKRAVGNLIKALGKDCDVIAVGTPEARRHRKWWQAKIEREGQSVKTANKDFHYLSGMLARFYDDLDHEDPPRPYAGVAIRDRHASSSRKAEVPVEWITEKWFAPGAFNGLNAEARDILLMSIETGCRQSEIYNLPASALKLDHPIPHIEVVNEASDDPDNRREVKNQSSQRQIPLVGVALEAAKRHAEGFPRYRNKSSYSATVNKFLRESKLLPEGVTIGGLRHSWESRMKKAGYDTDDRGELMGHSLKGRRGREVYGDSMPLAERQEIALSVMLDVPEHLMGTAENG